MVRRQILPPALVILLALLVVGPATGLAQTATPAPVATPIIDVPAPGTEILWDTWGVPHIYAPDAPSLFYAFGWAQMRNHANLILRGYADARGRAAEFFGEEFLPVDQLARSIGLQAHAEAWYRAQSPAFRANLDAFAAGINAYAREHPEAVADEVKAVLPVTAVDALASFGLGSYLFLAGAGGCLDVVSGGIAGSNAWAIAPSRSANGAALLLANPHLPWSGGETFFEAQLTAPGIYDAYGATLVGLPVLAFAFNDRLGWTHTVNTIDACDVYELDVAEGGYRFDGEVRPFEVRTETILVKQADGSLREQPFTARRSVHGPILAANGATLAVRTAGFEGAATLAGAPEQWWNMGRAQNLTEFVAVVERLQVPMFTFIYADAEGHILYLFNGFVPKRPTTNVDWSGIVPGDTSATLWTEIHPYDDLPKVIDPPSGWVQNANSPPWYATYPLQLDPDDFPPYMAPRFISWRERRSIRMLEENPAMSLERMVELKHSTRLELADRILDDLLAAARDSGDPVAGRAADVLAAWDREANPNSAGALLFAFWVYALEGQDPFALSDLFATPTDPTAPRTTPAGLADPEAAVAALVAAAGQVESTFGRLDVPWGEVAQLQRGAIDEPANGFPGDPFGVFRALYIDFSQVGAGEPLPVIAGDSFIAAVEFGDPVRARVLTTYGNASQPGSPHVGDQLRLAARGELRPAWLTRAEVEANLEDREVLG